MSLDSKGTHHHIATMSSQHIDDEGLLKAKREKIGVLEGDVDALDLFMSGKEALETFVSSLEPPNFQNMIERMAGTIIQTTIPKSNDSSDAEDDGKTTIKSTNDSNSSDAEKPHINLAFLIGWGTLGNEKEHKKTQLLLNKFYKPGAIIITGGDCITKSVHAKQAAKNTRERGPLMAEVCRSVMLNKMSPIHLAFQHEEYASEDSLYFTPTLFFPHADMYPGKDGKQPSPFYTGYDENQRVSGALRDFLFLVDHLRRKGHPVSVNTLCFGGGAIALSEINAILDMGEKGALHDMHSVPVSATFAIPENHILSGVSDKARKEQGSLEWTMTVFPIQDYPKRATNIPNTVAARRTSFSKWKTKEDSISLLVDGETQDVSYYTCNFSSLEN